MRSRSGANRMEQRAPSRIAAPIAGFPYRSAVYCRMGGYVARSEEHTSELQSLMRNSYAVFCLKKKNIQTSTRYNTTYSAYVIIFFFNTTATTEIHTYCHTLTRHDALPILVGGLWRARKSSNPTGPSA